MLFVIPRYHINAHYPINNGKSLDNIAVACKKMIDVVVDAAGYKTGGCFGLGRAERHEACPYGTAGTAVDNNSGKTLGDIVGTFKSIITHRFHDHIIRNENVLFRVRQYIQNNPSNWHSDKMNNSNNNRVHEIIDSYGEGSWMV